MMGTPDLKGVIFILIGIPSLLIMLAAVFLSIRKIVNKKDKEKKFSLLGLGDVKAWHLLAYCLSCPVVVAAYLIIGSSLGIFGLPSFSNFVFAALLFTGVFFPVYIIVFLLYFLYLAFRVKSLPGRQKVMPPAKARRRNNER